MFIKVYLFLLLSNVHGAHILYPIYYSCIWYLVEYSNYKSSSLINYSLKYTYKLTVKCFAKIKLSKTNSNLFNLKLNDYLPPKICIPSRAKMKMKRTRRTNRATMEEIELTKDFTRLPIADQYL